MKKLKTIGLVIISLMNVSIAKSQVQTPIPQPPPQSSSIKSSGSSSIRSADDGSKSKVKIETPKPKTLTPVATQKTGGSMSGNGPLNNSSTNRFTPAVNVPTPVSTKPVNIRPDKSSPTDINRVQPPKQSIIPKPLTPKHLNHSDVAPISVKPSTNEVRVSAVDEPRASPQQVNKARKNKNFSKEENSNQAKKKKKGNRKH